MCHCKNNIVKSNQKTPAGGDLYYFNEIGVCLIAYSDFSRVYPANYPADFVDEFRINKVC